MTYKNYSTLQLIKTYDELYPQHSTEKETQEICLELMCRAFATRPRDIAAFEWMDTHYGKRILRQVLNLSASRVLTSIVGEIGEDVLQQTYLKMFKRWQTVEAFEAFFAERLCNGVEGYLRTVMYATVCDGLRIEAPTPGKLQKLGDNQETQPRKTTFKFLPLDVDEGKTVEDERAVGLNIHAAAAYIRSILDDEEWIIIWGRHGLGLKPHGLSAMSRAH